METIKKIISLEAFKNRFNHKIPYINEDGNIVFTPKNIFQIDSEGNVITDPKDFSKTNGDIFSNNWGEIVCDYRFNNLEECSFSKIKDKLPLIECESTTNINESDSGSTKSYCFRYKTMVYWYNWLNNYGKTCTYYKVCNRNSNKVWVLLDNEKEYGDFFKTDYNFDRKITDSITKLPLSHDYKFGDIVELNINADILKETFRVNNDETRYELEVLNFIKEYFYNESINSENLSIPYIEIPIHISQTIDSLGILTPTAKEWDASITYYIGDTALYKTDVYTLYSGDSINMLTLNEGDTFLSFCDYISSGSENDFYSFEVYVDDVITDGLSPHEVVYDNGKKKIYYKKEGENIIEIKIPYLTHKANLNEKTGEYEFNTTYWRINKDECDEFNTNESGIILDGLLSGKSMDDNYGGVKVESKLSNFRRTKMSVDDDGNKLPFILDKKCSMDTELCFHVGVKNVDIRRNDIFRGDVMREITLESEDGNYILNFKYADNGDTVITESFYKKPDEIIENEIKLTDDIILKKNESAYTYVYKWVKNEGSIEKDETVETVESLPSAEEKYLNKTLQTSAQTNETVIYYINTCILEKIKVVYDNILNKNIMIKPSMLKFGNDDIIAKKGNITFYYLKDCLLKYGKRYIIENDSYGLSYKEKYPYEVSVAGVNLVSSKNLEENEQHIYELYDYEITENDEVAGNYWDADTSDMNNVGKIYQVVNENINGFRGYKRLLSNYNYIHINFGKNIYEVTSTDNVNLKKSVLLSTVQYNINDIVDDNFQKDYVFKNEYTIGVENILEEVDINVERGISSSFEKHHILSEIKSMSDLENYRNNLFNL